MSFECFVLSWLNQLKIQNLKLTSKNSKLKTKNSKLFRIFAPKKRMTITEIQNTIIEDFSFLESWEDRYEYMIDLGKSLPLIDPQYKTDTYLIKGCQSQVWLHADNEGDIIHFTADSDAIITKGIIAILIKALSGQKAADILAADMSFIDKIGLKEHLSPTRANGLVSMIEQMKLYAKAITLKNN